MLPETRKELSTILEELVDELRTELEELDPSKLPAFDHLVCEIQDLLEQYRSEVDLDV